MWFPHAEEVATVHSGTSSSRHERLCTFMHPLYLHLTLFIGGLDAALTPPSDSILLFLTAITMYSNLR